MQESAAAPRPAPLGVGPSVPAHLGLRRHLLHPHRLLDLHGLLLPCANLTLLSSHQFRDFLLRFLFTFLRTESKERDPEIARENTVPKNSTPERTESCSVHSSTTHNGQEVETTQASIHRDT